MTHKHEDLKLTAVIYYLDNDEIKIDLNKILRDQFEDEYSIIYYI